MSTVALEPLFLLCSRKPSFHCQKPFPLRPFFLPTCSSNLNDASFIFHQPRRTLSPVHAASLTDTPTIHSPQCPQTTYTFEFNRTQMVKGKIFVRLDHGKDLKDWELTVGCSLPGKWILHWGVTLVDDTGREWDQPPRDMIPPGSISIKDYAIETPFKMSSLSAEGETLHEVRIDIKARNGTSAIHFVLKDEETGAWYKKERTDFVVSLVNYLKADSDTSIIEPKRGFGFWPANLWQTFKMLFKSKADKSNQPEGFYEEVYVTKKVSVNNSISVSTKKCFECEAVKDILYLETDLPGDVVLHWGVCRDDSRTWEVPPPPHPPGTVAFKDRALRTQFRPKDGGKGSSAQITLEQEFAGFIFVLRQNGNTWFKYFGNDFYVPLSSSSSLLNTGNREDLPEGVQIEKPSQENSLFAFTDTIANEIRNLVRSNSSEKNQKIKSKKAQQSIFYEIERLAAEAYNIFRSSIPTFFEPTTAKPEATNLEPETTIVVPETSVESEILSLDPKICSATGTGYEILCQGFNWESHESGRWYMELKEIASELAFIGFTVVWLPPPTESVSPEGYMPKDLYNLNSRYGNIDELKDLVKRFHEVGIKAIGDAVLNHRCAHYQNQNGVWNVFGGCLDWDDRAVVSDDPYFQGRGNKSSGDHFHAAPNIDHSQEFVRKDLKEWLCWLRKEIGYDGWRLDFVRGFWGGYIKDYIEASEPYFSVGEYWDSLSYTDGETDHNQDGHRQRIVDWIRATNGTSSAFDVTTKGILHAALENCEYRRLSDEEGKPPGVIGWWPSRAVTFIENHDTGSTQGHWRFPSGKEMQGYAYILTHPGTPSVFYDHIFSHHKTEIASLISLRKRNKIHCRSTVEISKAETYVYAAIIDEKVAVKIGPGNFEPPSGSQKWSLAIKGKDYKIWEAS